MTSIVFLILIKYYLRISKTNDNIVEITQLTFTILKFACVVVKFAMDYIIPHNIIKYLHITTEPNQANMTDVNWLTLSFHLVN